jgi:hypothetical protein
MLWTRVRAPPPPPIKKPTLLKWVLFFKVICNYLTSTESTTLHVEFFVESQHSFFTSSVAFLVDDFSPQDVIRDIVEKTTNEIKNNFFIF